MASDAVKTRTATRRTRARWFPSRSTAPRADLIASAPVTTTPPPNSALDEDTGGADDDETHLDELATELPAAKSFTRGMNPRAVVGWVRSLHGEQGVAALAASLPAHVVTDLGGPMLRPPLMSWVPFLSHAELLVKIDERFGAGDLRLLTDVGRAAAYRDFPSLARPFARMLSPGLVVDMATRIWSVYHSAGTWEVSRGERDLQAVLVNRPESHPAFCVAMLGWIEGAMLFAGAVDVRAVEERCAAKGATCCSVRMSWREKKDTVRDRRPRAPS